ncbi:MAG: hypothetical protein AAF581_10220 [Planctomycetota bacterium]
MGAALKNLAREGLRAWGFLILLNVGLLPLSVIAAGLDYLVPADDLPLYLGIPVGIVVLAMIWLWLGFLFPRVIRLCYPHGLPARQVRTRR